MNRRALVLGTAALGVVAFAGGASLVARQRQADAAQAAAAPLPFDPAILVRPYSPILGPADAPVTIVEFFDPSCEACRAFHPVLEEIRETYPTQVRIVLRYTPFHQGSDEAVRILEAARGQGKFEQVLNALFEKQPEWAEDGSPDLDLAWRIAGAVGLDIAKGKANRMLPGTVAILNQDIADVETAGIQGTPTFFINGKPLAQLGVEELKVAVRREVEAL